MLPMWILFSMAVAAFIWMLVKLVLATRDTPVIDTKIFKPALAGGHLEEDNEVEELEIPLTEFVFKDKNGIDLPIEEYDGYVAKGKSMKLAGIVEGDLMLVPKNYKFQSSTPLPDVFILHRERIDAEGHENVKAKYKLRRVWALAYLGGSTSLEDVMKVVMGHPVFIDLLNNPECGISPQQLWDEFFDEVKGRFSKYKAEHPHWNDPNHEDSIAVISTTLRPNDEPLKTGEKGEHVSFSIHPSKLIVGAVSYVYSNPSMEKSVMPKPC